MSFDFEHLKKLCVCKRFKTKGFDYGQIHPVLGKCGIGMRWTEPLDQINLAQKKFIQIEQENEKLRELLRQTTPHIDPDFMEIDDEDDLDNMRELFREVKSILENKEKK